MRSLQRLEATIRAIAWSGRSLPVKAVVDRAYATASEGGYAADLEVVHRATHARTGEELSAVPLQPLWLGADGRGLFAPPEPDQIVVVNWVEGDRAHPYIAGAAADRYTPAASAQPGKLVLTDGRGAELVIEESLWRVANRAQSLLPLVQELIDTLLDLRTVGPPAPHTLDGVTQAHLQDLMSRFEELFRA